MANSLHPRSRNLFYLSLLFSFLILLIFVGEVTLIKDPQTRVIVTDITFPVFTFLVTGVLFLASVLSIGYSRRAALAWGIIASAQLANSLGDLTWSILELGLGITPFPSLADVFYLAYYPLFFAGSFLLPGKHFTSREWLKKGLDIGVVLIASILIFGNFLIGPVASSVQEDPLMTRLLSLAYPTGDLLLLWALLVILYNRSNIRFNIPVILLGASMIVVIATDSIFSYQSQMGTYTSGTLLDIGWIIGYLITGFAGLHQILYATSNKQETQITKERSYDFFEKIAAYMPYLWLVGAYALLLLRNQIDLYMQFSTIALAVSGIIGLILVRQVIVLAENRHLLEQQQLMMQQAQAQAENLEKANHALREEIAHRQRAEEQLSYDTMHDGLTNLPNRVLFLDRLGQAIEYTHRRSEQSFSILFIDLDHFKIVNDSLGHSIGDQLLILIGQRLRNCLRSSDTVARLGGDEFVILLENTGNNDGVMHVAERIQSTISEVYQIGGHEVFTTASIGVVLDLSGYSNAEEALRDADIAMYRSKTLGKARIEVFNPELRNQAVMRLVMENELRHAIKHFEFELYYQPIYSLVTDRITGFEALIRWNHPTRGLLSPDDFLPVAEDSGLILPLGKWILHQACSQISQWRQMFPDYQYLTMNVNISGKQFKQPDFVEQVVRTLEETGIPSSSLKLEITESMVIDNPAVANQYFARLRDLGIQLQVDDFGTGYSSLSYLQSFPIQAIKIDRSFINDVAKPGKNSDLVRTMVRMAHDLGMDAVAEGIETEQQRDELKRLMCQFGQGYLMAKPMHKGQVVEILKNKATIYPVPEQVSL